MRLLIAACAVLLAVGPAAGQPAPPRGPGPVPFAAAPASGMPLLTGPGLVLPATLPGGAPLPVLPEAAQQEILNRILEAGGGRVPQPPAAASARSLPAAEGEPASPAEAFFAARDPGSALRQIGYDSLRGGAAPAGIGFGALPDDYLLGRDDELILAFRGRARQTLTLRIGRDGMLLVPDLPPVPAAGRTLRALRADLEARAAQDLGGSEVFVSVGQVRQIAIFVGGEVARPGLVPLTAHASVLEALVAAGGIRKTGSLRAIRVEGGTMPRLVDLYPVIVGAGGTTPDLALREGERILVPPLGGVVALAGEVTRPGIYELPAAATAAPLTALLALAGQPLRPAGNRFLMQTADAGGRRNVQEIAADGMVRRGDLVRVEPGTDVQANQVRLAGHVAPDGAPVLRAAQGGRGRSLRALLADPLLVRPDPYPPLGVVWRTDRRSRARHFIAFDLAAVLRGAADLPLVEGDEVILVGLGDIQWLSSPAVQRAVRGEPPSAATIAPDPVNAATIGLAGGQGQVPAPAPGSGPAADCQALHLVALAAQSSRQRFGAARGAGFPDLGRYACPQVFQDYPTLLPFLLDQAMVLTGEARLPGLYPVLPGTPLGLVVTVAGGTTPGAALDAVEVTTEGARAGRGMGLTRAVLTLDGGLGGLVVGPQDSVRIPRGEAERELGPVTLVGEFIRPGTYDLRRGERLSDLIARAGGLTAQAYPYGAVFSRDSVRQRQQEGFQRTARELEQGLMQVAAGQAVVAPRGTSVDVAGAVQAGQSLAASLRQARAAGRMVVEANPVVLATRPDLDPLLEPGDLIAMPKRPAEVTVVGAVLNPGSLQFAPQWRAAQYIAAAGGRQRFADGGRAFVVLPNGQAVPAGQGWFGEGGPPVPPGSVVVVPQDPSPYEGWAFLRDLTQVFGQLALSSAALAVINSAR